LSDQEKQKRRFRHWAFLNAAGKKKFGDVFPDGLVPVVSMIPRFADVGDHCEGVYLVFHDEMSEDQIRKFVEMLAGVFGALEAAVKAELLKDRVALRERYVDGAGTDGLPLFV